MADVTDASRLVAYALDWRQRPSEGSDYQTLLAAYRTDPAYAELVRKVCSGLGLFPLDATRRGFVVAPLDDSPFALRLGDVVPTGTTPSDRCAFGLVILAVAAFGYPDADALDGTAIPTVRVGDLERFLEVNAATVAGAAAEDLDIDPQAATAAAEWLRRNPLDETAGGSAKRGQVKKGCRRWYVLKAFEILTGQGLARAETALGDDVYQLTDRFRLTIANTASTAAYRHLAAARKRETS
jgi:hypothetical protein